MLHFHIVPKPLGTTNRTIVNDLKASLIARLGVDAGTTWGEFKAAMERLGVADDTPLASIEFGVSRYGNGNITLDTGEDGIEIREARF